MFDDPSFEAELLRHLPSGKRRREHKALARLGVRTPLLLLVHEQRAHCDGVPFDDIKAITSDELLGDRKIYKDVAIPVFGGSPVHLRVSLRLILKSIGAEPARQQRREGSHSSLIRGNTAAGMEARKQSSTRSLQRGQTRTSIGSVLPAMRLHGFFCRRRSIDTNKGAMVRQELMGSMWNVQQLLSMSSKPLQPAQHSQHQVSKVKSVPPLSRLESQSDSLKCLLPYGAAEGRKSSLQRGSFVGDAPPTRMRRLRGQGSSAQLLDPSALPADERRASLHRPSHPSCERVHEPRRALPASAPLPSPSLLAAHSSAHSESLKCLLPTEGGKRASADESGDEFFRRSFSCEAPPSRMKETQNRVARRRLQAAAQAAAAVTTMSRALHDGQPGDHDEGACNQSTADSMPSNPSDTLSRDGCTARPPLCRSSSREEALTVRRRSSLVDRPGRDVRLRLSKRSHSIQI
jgi:hypothetical protein